MQDTNSLIDDIYELKSTKKQLEEVINNLKSTITNIESKISNKEVALLAAMKESNTATILINDVVAARFKKENIGYTNDNDVLNYLKSIGRADLIKLKITESLDKINLKKAIKTDTTLADNLASMTTHSTTEYVVVTSYNDYEKMLGHINEKSEK